MKKSLEERKEVTLAKVVNYAVYDKESAGECIFCFLHACLSKPLVVYYM